MAAPIAHIFLAVQMLSGPFKHFNEKEFIVGTSFPDIRYLKVVKRTETHFKNITLEDILQEKNSFKAGMLFHSFVDEQREKFIARHKLYDELPKFKFISQSLKLAEDKIIKDQFNIAQYHSYFSEILVYEKAFEINDIYVQTWHDFLQKYFKGDYSHKELIMKYYDLYEPDSWLIKRWFFSFLYANKMQKTLNTIVQDQKIKDMILDFYLNFKEIIKK